MTTPSLRLIASAALRGSGAGEVRSVLLVGDYPPRRCGIATFTADVRQALLSARPDLVCEVAALTDRGQSYNYPAEVAYEIRQDEPEDYRAAARRINASAPDVICVQHEFGIFGGPAGEQLLTLLDAVEAPVVSTFHTILERPDADQRRVFERLIARSSRVVVMAERGRDMLRRTWGVPDEKIVLVPHGAPDAPLEPTAPFKARLGFAGRDLLFTFGLLSPNKGLETAIRAMPAVVAARPDALYVVLGATHPHLVAQEGERYRDSLKALAEELGVADHVRFVDSYADTPRLLQYLNAADVYVTPYLNVEQITSGTLSYAAALGKPIVSTPYWHAEELLAEERGVLVPFADAPALAEAVIGFLSSPERLEAVRRRIYDATRSTVWSRFGERYLETFSAALEAGVAEAPVRIKSPSRPPPSLKGVRRMTDSCGMLQHSLYSLPDRRHGYCVDDNARALILMHRWPGAPDEERRALTGFYAAFVQHAWNPDTGRFRNFMSYERAWLESAGSEDSTGRAFWSVGVSACEAHGGDHRRWARALLSEVLPHADGLLSPRAEAFVILGLAAAGSSAGPAGRDLLAAKAKKLAGRLGDRRAEGHPWFETYLSYDNARLPEALIRAGAALENAEVLEAGLSALDWLCRRQTSPAGLFRPVSTVDFGLESGSAGVFDQQPLEASATVEACQAALAASGDARWAEEAERAYAWFFGVNDLGASLAGAGEGECFDGLNCEGVNRNQGAESVLALQMAACAFQTLTNAGRARLKTAGDL